MSHVLSRRLLLAAGTATAAGLVAGAGLAASRPTAPPDPPDAAEAWRRLESGNARFAAGTPDHPHQDPAWRESLAGGQHPFACVLDCADSRVPPELIFDQGLGDLFTVRTAGEVLDDAVVGSIEYAAEHLHVPLIVVLGHSGCGAVRAAIDLVHGAGSTTGAVNTMARAIEAAVRSTPPDPDPAAFWLACVHNQARRVAVELAERSNAIGSAAQAGAVEIVPSAYDLRSGRVRRLD
ncbi:MAG TPA: carbonic anhydrase [Actinophytocola sp.]|uniref:carbonic anhydrase n=1 Tax=Actinophytocola sp. TaxID=1872138 RepID=UPI002DDCD8A6|nr:carbonic anhydrase [Actinophytocola sp.]HEV2780221.1 carbonic anhydrase [Actinophytocola sp.]